MGSAKQTKGKGSASIPDYLKQSGELATKQQRFLFKGAKPIQKELFGQTLEALRTGGVGAQIPIIQRALEGTKQATSGALRGTEAALGGSNLINTPFGQQILAQQRQAGAVNAANIPVELAQGFISGAPGLSGGSMGLAAQLGGGGQSGAASAFGSAQNAAAQRFGPGKDATMSVGSGLGKLVAGAKGGGGKSGKS